MRFRGPAILAVLSLAPLPLWFSATSAGTWTGGAEALLTAAAIGCGLVGFCSYGWNVVLGGRLHPIERLFGGLGPLYETHRVNGRIAYLLVLAHVCLMLAGRAQSSIGSAAALLSPGAGLAVGLGVVAFASMTLAIGATLYARLTHETFIYVQRALGGVYVIVALHVFLVQGTTTASQPLMVYLGVVTSAAASAFVYRSLFGNLLVRRFEYVVTNVRELDTSVVEITMQPTGEHLHAKPGQFVFVTFYSDSFSAKFHPLSVTTEGKAAVITLRPGDARNQFHPFSLTSTAGDPFLRLVIKAVGDFTTALHSLEAGAGALVEGPYGEFSYLNVPSARQVWVAGGIGITPFLSMARSLPPTGYEAHLFYGVKRRSDAFFLDELEEIARRVEGFSVELVAEDERGFITAEMIGEGPGWTDRDLLIVGPPAMQAALGSRLMAVGVPHHRIHTERFAFGSQR